MSSDTPAWLADPEPEAKPSTSTSISMNNPDVMPGWAVDDVENQASSDNHLQMVTVGTETAAPPTTTPPPPTDGDNKAKSATETASSKTWGDYFWGIFQRDGRLLLITLAIIVLMNIPFIKWVMYPFSIFSTWVHEFCHGMAAVLVGGKVYKLEIFPDTSGLATTAVAGDRRGFVVSAGYQGTAVIGCLLLIFRRTKRGPRTGTMALGITMLLTVMLWIRNAFGIVFIGLMGLMFAALAWRLPSTHMRNFYICVAVTTCLNAITSVNNLFGSSHVVNGQEEEGGSDAHTMADIKGGSSSMWAFLWLMLALVLATLGFLFAIPGPDEVADFTCCGVCQDLGLFKICNLPGKRLIRRIYNNHGGSTTSGSDENNNGNTTNNNS